MLLSHKRKILLRRFSSKPKKMEKASVHEAVRSCDVISLTRLLLHGVDVNTYDSQGLTPLHIACETGNEDLAVILLAMGADVCLAISGTHGAVPALVIAATHGHIGCLQVLLDAGAPVDAADAWGNTALFKAASYNHTDCVKALLHHGATPDLQNQWGATALQYATIQGHTDILRLLLNNGSDPSVRGETAYASPLAAALLSEHTQCLELLLEAGGDPNTKTPSGVNLLLHIINNFESEQDMYTIQLLLDHGATITSDCIKSLAKHCKRKGDISKALSCTDSDILGHDLYNLIITLITSLPSCETKEATMNNALTDLFNALNSARAFESLSLLVKLGYVPSQYDLPTSLAQELGLLGQAKSLVQLSAKVIREHIKTRDIVYLPLPKSLISYICSSLNNQRL